MKTASLVSIATASVATLCFATMGCAQDPTPTITVTPEQHRGPSLSTGGIFVDVTADTGVGFVHNNFTDEFLAIGAGAVVIDFDGDGLQDIYVADSDGPNVLYRNNGDSTFKEVAADTRLDDPNGRGNGGCAADYDNDGDQDLYATNYGHSKLHRNNGDGTFSNVTAQAGLGPSHEEFRDTGCAWGDYDQDGHVDLIVARHIPDQDVELLFQRVQVTAVGGVTLFNNLGDGTFRNVTPLLGDSNAPKSGMYDVDRGNVWGAGFQPGWVDLDNDHDPDLYVVNDMGTRVHPNVLWRNDGPDINGIWRFTDISVTSGTDARIDGMALAVGDYDLDGHLDLFMTDIGNNVLLKNEGTGLTFTDRTKEAGVGVGSIGVNDRVTWGAVFFDYDNDGLEDLYIVSGHLRIRGFTDRPNYELEQPNVLLRNNGDLTFENISVRSGADDAGVGRGGVFLDYNSDGCLDIFVVNYGQQSRLFRNECASGNNWLILDLEGVVSNRDGIGTRVEIDAGGKTQIREISGGSSHMGQNMSEAHFGIGDNKVVDSIKLRWPSGIEQTLYEVGANQRIKVTEPAG